MSNKVRTRFAPSPTGYMHIGNLRTALYEYLIARSFGGTFILRIEDTDRERYVEGATDVIFETLRQTGMTYDEGPGVGGDYGPYIQSERMGLYKDYAEQLVREGKAYYCFCTKERLESIKVDVTTQGDALAYDRHCRNLSQEEIDANLKAGMPYVIRQKMPTEGTTTFHDAVYGDISVENKTLEDQILLKADGMPTYNFANVIDDHLMAISHVVRGNEYLSSTPKYNLLYEAFGWEIPTYVHCVPVMKDQHQKLSKRNGDASFQDLVAKGYLPEAIVNYIVLLGWSPSENREIYSLEELEKVFDIKGLSKSPSIFDPDKLRWMNGEYIKKLSDEKFTEIAKPWILKAIPDADDALIEKIVKLIRGRTEVFGDIPEKIEFINKLPEYEAELYRHKKMKTDPENSLGFLKCAQEFLEQYNGEWVSQSLYEALCTKAQELEIKNSQLLWPLRTALSGLPASPGGATELAELLGKEETLKRVAIGIELLSK